MSTTTRIPPRMPTPPAWLKGHITDSDTNAVSLSYRGLTSSGEKYAIKISANQSADNRVTVEVDTNLAATLERALQDSAGDSKSVLSGMSVTQSTVGDTRRYDFKVASDDFFLKLSAINDAFIKARLVATSDRDLY